MERLASICEGNFCDEKMKVSGHGIEGDCRVIVIRQYSANRQNSPSPLPVRNIKTNTMSLYSQRGVSAQKEDVHEATRMLDKGLYP